MSTETVQTSSTSRDGAPWKATLTFSFTQFLNSHNRLFCFTLIGVPGSRLSPLEQCQLILIFSMAQKNWCGQVTWPGTPCLPPLLSLCYQCCSPSRLGINQNHSLNGILFTLCSQYDYEHGTTEMVSEVGWCLACFETQWHKIKKEEEMVAKKKKDPKLVFYFN